MGAKGPSRRFPAQFTDTMAAPIGERLAKSLIAPKSVDGGRDRIDVLRVEEESRVSGLLRKRGDVRARCRYARREGLPERKARGFESRRDHDSQRSVVQGLELVGRDETRP